MIKLKETLDWELTRIGLEPGDVITDHSAPGKDNGAISFEIHYNGFRQTCVVWPVNYEIIDNK